MRKLNCHRVAFFGSVLFTALVLLAAGCFSVGNNHLEVKHLVDHLAASNIPVTAVAPVNPKLLGAGEGLAVTIALPDGKEQDIGVYKYNIDVETQRKKLDFCKENGFVYVNGLKFQTFVNGSFVLIGVEKNPYKTEILKALETFGRN
ncbi:hypothetical protein [Victivallis sp. Marseille-Q1083]|uniref:hypothetical protein n=1 Tax=Victivallis sp. Marseille-Q1083 TaxID=2717288 RepID=UPI00158E2037|nr:hypothetical protein [Victivallis sp. Marseille-Q1083]